MQGDGTCAGGIEEELGRTGLTGAQTCVFRLYISTLFDSVNMRDTKKSVTLPPNPPLIFKH